MVHVDYRAYKLRNLLKSLKEDLTFLYTGG